MYRLRIGRYDYKTVFFYIFMVFVSLFVVHLSYDNIMSVIQHDGSPSVITFAVICGYVMVAYLVIAWLRIFRITERSNLAWVEIVEIHNEPSYMIGYTGLGMPFEKVWLSDIVSISDGELERDDREYRYVVARTDHKLDMNHLSHYASWMEDKILFGLYECGYVPIVCLPYITILDKLRWWYVRARLFAWWRRNRPSHIVVQTKVI